MVLYFPEWSNPILCMAPTSTELLQPWLIRSLDYFLTLLVDGQTNSPITAFHHGIQPIICAVVVHDPQFEQEPIQAVESVSLFTSEELVAEYHSITTSVQLIENVEDEDSVAKQSIKKEIESSDGKNIVQKQLQSRDMCIQSITNQFVQHSLEYPKGKRPKSSILDVFHGELSVVETSKNEALSEEFDPKEYDKNVDESGDGKGSVSEIISVLTGQVSCDKYVGGFYECESAKLYYTDPKEYLSSSMTQLLKAVKYAEFDFDNSENDSSSDMVKTEEEDIHLDGLETVDDPFVQNPDRQNSEEMSMYVNEVNVVNQNQPPSSEKVVGQLMRKRFVGKALVEPYTVQPPTTAPSTFFKVDRKRLKRKARMLQIQNTRISFDDDVGDGDPDFKVFSLEEWESTKLKKKQNKKEPIRQSQIALPEIPLVEFHEDFSIAPYSRRTKVKLPQCLDMVYALGDETSYIFPWGNNDIFVYRSFWLNLLGLKEGGWLSDIHLDAWFELIWCFRPTDADWAIASSYFYGFVMRGDIPRWVCNGVTYLVMWVDVEQECRMSVRIKSHLNAVGITDAHTDVNTTLMELVLLVNFKDNILSGYYCWLQKLVSQLELLGEKISQEDINQKLLRSLSPEWNTHVVVWRNKEDFDTMSMDDLYINLKVNTNGVVNTTQAVNTANGVSTANTQVNAAFSTNIDNLSDVVICAFLASQPNSPQLAHEDLEQIHPDDMDGFEMENGHIDYEGQKRGHFARKCRAPGNQDNRHKESTRKSVSMETPAFIALVSCDGLDGYDWTDQAEEGPNYALMAYTSLSFDSKVALGGNLKRGKITTKCTIKTGDKDETIGILKSFISRIENLVDHKVKVIRCDNETDFKNREMNQFCEMKGILRQFSVARTPQQNRVAERRNKTLIEATRTMLADSKLPTTFWAEAVNKAC
uniref:Putative ribonuclease H-like domain-containing protein n=1 Tax=Tanacetum cinerariifolium TaxID=118510 RepID=A0A6L2J9M2_TANCI|nr:putative ribonuclease H-like domain-containing protein [Tanacetum cinerariifolium]